MTMQSVSPGKASITLFAVERLLVGVVCSQVSPKVSMFDEGSWALAALPGEATSCIFVLRVFRMNHRVNVQVVSAGL